MKSLVFLGLTLAVPGYFFAMYQVLSKNWWNLQPSHLLKAKCFCATALSMFWGIVLAVFQSHFYPPGIPCLHNPGSLFVKMYHLLAIVVRQIERFLAIKRPFLR